MDATFLTFPLVMIVFVVFGLVVYKKSPRTAAAQWTARFPFRDSAPYLVKYLNLKTDALPEPHLIFLS